MALTVRHLTKRTTRDERSHCTECNDHIGMNVIIAASKSHKATRATIPLFIGLSVGFCGSSTPFSSCIRDAFLSLPDNLDTGVYSSSKPAAGPRYSRNPGNSVMGVLALLIVVCRDWRLHIGSTTRRSCSYRAPACNVKDSKAERERSPGSARYPRRLGPFGLERSWWLFGLQIILLSPMGQTCCAPTRESWRGGLFFPLHFAPTGCLARFHIPTPIYGISKRKIDTTRRCRRESLSGGRDERWGGLGGGWRMEDGAWR